MAEVFKQITSKHHNHWDTVLGQLDKSGEDLKGDERSQMLAKRAFLRWRRLAGHEPNLEAQMRDGTGELFPGWTHGIRPRVEERVKPASKGEAPEEDRTASAEGSRRTPGSVVKKAKAVVADGLAKLKK